MLARRIVSSLSFTPTTCWSFSKYLARFRMKIVTGIVTSLFLPVFHNSSYRKEEEFATQISKAMKSCKIGVGLASLTQTQSSPLVYRVI